MTETLTRYLAELRAEVKGNTLVGHAAVFDQLAELPTGYEQLARGAFDAVLADPATDTRALINHDESKVLGRLSAGTLRLSVDNSGLAFEVDLPDTSYARDLQVLVARGDLTGASFGFVPGADDWSRAPDGRVLRTHTSVARLIDVSAVTYPAYEGTDVSLRAMEFPPPNYRARLIRLRARLLKVA